MHTVENESQPAQAIAEIKKAVPWIYFVIFFAVFNESVFNVSTPNIARQFGLDAAGVSWVVTIFFIVFGMGMVIFGKLSDIFNIRTLITIGIILYGFGSLLGFVGQSWYPAVILARAIQGAGGSAIPALVFVMVARYFSPQERGKLFGVITSTASFAVGIGPVLGGYIAATFHWSFLFLASLPVLAALPSFRRLLPVEPRRPGTIDVPGAVWLSTVVAMVILFTTEGWWLYGVAALIALILFMLRIRRAKEPFVHPALFANRLYLSGVVIGFLIFGTVMSVMFVIPLMFSNLYSLNADQIGMLMFPGAMSAVVFGKVAGHLTVKRGSHFVVYLGLGLVSLSLLLQSSSVGWWVWYIGCSLIIMYIGFSLVQTALAESITQILPHERMGVGMGFFNMLSTISGAVVTALVAKALEQELFRFPFHPAISDPQAFMYGNLLLLLSLIVISTACLYVFTFGRRVPQQTRQPQPQDSLS